MTRRAWRSGRSLRKSGPLRGDRIRGRTVTLKAKFADFQQVTRSHTGVSHIETQAELERLGLALLGPIFPARKGIRLLGVTLSTLGGERLNSGDQLNLKF